MKLCFQNLEKDRGDKTDLDRLLLFLIMEQIFPMNFLKIELFLFSKSKVIHLF